MAAQLTAYGLLVEEPQRKTTSKGAKMAVSRLAVYLPCDSSRNGQKTLWLSLVAFGEQADTLTSYRKGDLIIVSGGMRSAKRRGRDGKIIRGYQVSADLIEPYRKATAQEATAQA
ncbi:single-stranded DNA-binding protein [Salmonella enterica subsp. enterica serovar Hvittingfoss]|nr:single-stranded DNA-binding protein [Salmonella enterica subsp. enterica serovar Hvittingfoss]EGF6520412.1 single-stranded DNA-binding protein [Salmonella enterica]